MKIKRGKIISCTEDELYSYWLKHDLDDVYPFDLYVQKMKAAGVDVLSERYISYFEYYAKDIKNMANAMLYKSNKKWKSTLVKDEYNTKKEARMATVRYLETVKLKELINEEDSRN